MFGVIWLGRFANELLGGVASYAASNLNAKQKSATLHQCMREGSFDAAHIKRVCGLTCTSDLLQPGYIFAPLA